MKNKTYFSLLLVFGLLCSFIQQPVQAQTLHWDANIGLGAASPLRVDVYPKNDLNVVPLWTVGTFLGIKHSGPGMYINYSRYQWKTDTLLTAESPILSRHNILTTAVSFDAKIAPYSSLRLTLGPTLNMIYDGQFERWYSRIGSMGSVAVVQGLDEYLFLFLELGFYRANIGRRERYFSWSNTQARGGFGINLIRGKEAKKTSVR